MAQAYIDRVIHNNSNGIQHNQISELRAKYEFSDCDEHLMIEIADEMERAYKKNKKRKFDEPFQKKEHAKKPKLDEKFICDFCQKKYKYNKNLKRHMKIHHATDVESFPCVSCEKTYTSKTSLMRHQNNQTLKCDICYKHFARKSMLKKHVCKQNKELENVNLQPNTTQKNKHTCRHCGIPFDDYGMLFNHVVEHHPLNQSGGQVENISEQRDHPTSVNENIVDNNKERRVHYHKSALDKTVNEISIIPLGDEKYDLLRFLANAKDDVNNELITYRDKHRNIKWYLNARVEMIRDIEGDDKEKVHPHFRSKSYISLSNQINDHNLNEAFQSINQAMEDFINKGSNWILNKVICLEVHILPYSPITGSSYMELPSKIRYSSGIVNIQNHHDQKCFLWSILAALHPTVQNPNRVSHYIKYENELDMDGIEYPVTLANMQKFEKQNLISINVFGFEEGEAFPLYLSKLPNGYRELDLLYLSNENKTHYCWIKNLDRFIGSTRKFCNKRFYCRRCLHGFIRKDLLDQHRQYCNKFDFQRVTYPEEGKNDWVQFKDFHKSMRVPFVIYADFECYAKKIDTCHPDPEKSSTTHTTKFEPSGFSYIVVSTNDKFSKQAVVYRGDNVVQHFFEHMIKEEEYIQSKLNIIEPLIMNGENEEKFQAATKCYICDRIFTDTLIKVRDHDHLGVSGDPTSSTYSNYRGAACQRCNLNIQYPPFIPVYFHNLKNFDGHLLLSEAGKYKAKKLTCIPNNMEKYISFSLGKLRFLDSYQCMDSSLETLVDNLAAEGTTHFKQFCKAFPDDDIAQLLLQKNEYCYDYVDCSEQFNETQLPPKEAFYNSLTKEHISDEKYNHAQKVWNKFNMKTLGEFHDLYVLTDVLLLADVFERFRDMTLENYKLDASHFYTSPGLAFQAALRMSEVCLDLITNPLMYQMIELGTRGGISMVVKKKQHGES